MKKNKILNALSSIIWFILLIGIIITFIDFILVKSDKKPIFCLKHEVKENVDGNTYICTGIAYKYYNTVGKGYVSKKFVPIWKNVEDTHE